MVVLLSTSQPKSAIQSEGILNFLEQDIVFRNCVLANDTACIEAAIENALPSHYQFSLTQPDVDKDVVVEHLLIAGNLTLYRPTKVHLYYWKR